MTKKELKEFIKRQYSKKSKEELLDIFSDFLVKMIICYSHSNIVDIEDANIKTK